MRWDDNSSAILRDRIFNSAPGQMGQMRETQATHEVKLKSLNVFWTPGMIWIRQGFFPRQQCEIRSWFYVSQKQLRPREIHSSQIQNGLWCLWSISLRYCWLVVSCCTSLEWWGQSQSVGGDSPRSSMNNARLESGKCWDRGVGEAWRDIETRHGQKCRQLFGSLLSERKCWEVLQR